MAVAAVFEIHIEISITERPTAASSVAGECAAPGVVEDRQRDSPIEPVTAHGPANEHAAQQKEQRRIAELLERRPTGRAARSPGTAPITTASTTATGRWPESESVRSATR